ncbi:twin-arginine translocation signal domain-containing protein [Vibrio sp. YIC-376]
MNKHDNNNTIASQDLPDASRRNALKLTGAGVVALALVHLQEVRPWQAQI